MMKRIAGMLLAVFLAAALSGCARAGNVMPLSSLSADQAKTAAQTYLREQFGESANPPAQLYEITPKNVFEQTGFQVFSDKSESGANCFLVYGKKAVGGIIGFGGFGLSSLAAANFDGRGNQVVYAYSWGSGLHRSILEVCDGDYGTFSLYADFSGKNMMVERESKNSFGVYEAVYGDAADSPKKGEKLGTLRGKSAKTGYRLTYAGKDGSYTQLVTPRTREVLAHVSRVANPADPSVSLSSNTANYIEAGRADFDAVVAMGEEALPALLEEVVGKQRQGLDGCIMQAMIREIAEKLGAADQSDAALYRRYVG